jgi:drug/metabolite transporter (DMT)-like permease
MTSRPLIVEPVDRPPSTPIDPTGLLNLFVVYFVYGSTYLAIRIAVREGGGFPPFTLGFIRLTLAGGMLLLWAALRRKRLRLGRREGFVLALSGMLFWTFANGLVNWSEQRADSGLAALIIASTPILVAVMESLLDRKLPTLRLSLALLVGFVGIVLLSYPSLSDGSQADVYALIGLVIASASWGAGSILMSRYPFDLPPEVTSGYQMLIGGLMLAPLVLIAQEPRPTPSPQAWWAWGYLVIFGSVIAFTAFMRALRLLPSSVAMTYAFVNPVIAVLLGMILLQETISVWTVGGALLVLLGVAGVFRERYV